MIDKIVMTKNNCVSIVYTDKCTVTIHSDQNEALALFHWMQTPTVIKLSDYKKAQESAMEATQEIKVA